MFRPKGNLNCVPQSCLLLCARLIPTLRLSHQTFLRRLFLVCCTHTPQITWRSDVCPLTQGALEQEMWGLFCFPKSWRLLWDMVDASCGTSNNTCYTDFAKKQSASAHRVRIQESEHGCVPGCLQVYLNSNWLLEFRRGSWTVKSRRLFRRF